MEIDRDMTEPVLALARFMARGEEEGLADSFVAERLVIIENFPPFLFIGPDAFERWREGFIDHAEVLELAGLRFDIGQPQELGRKGERAFFTLPVRWRGTTLGEPFDERGAWTFVLEREDARWRILSYAWGVTSKA
jgi:hypothetical protein